MKKSVLILFMVLITAVLSAQGTWIYPEVSVTIELEDTYAGPGYIIAYIDVETDYLNYGTWLDADYFPFYSNTGDYSIPFASDNSGIPVWKPNPLYQNYYLLNVHVEKWWGGVLLARDNAYVIAHLDASDNLKAINPVYLYLN